MKAVIATNYGLPEVLQIQDVSKLPEFVYNPQPEQLKKIRQEMDYAFDEWTTIIMTNYLKKLFQVVSINQAF